MMHFPLYETNKLIFKDDGVYHSGSPGTDYSEGAEAEEYLHKVFTDVQDLSSHSVDLEREIKDWSSEYHLTAARANIVRCLNLSHIGRALELGCGCGAITRYLGETGIAVDGVEGGLTRAQLARQRCRDLDNVKIIRANFNELELPCDSYDAVFMIGVIEYAEMFSSGNKRAREAVAEIFSRVRSTLKPGGLLIMALENRMGLKYLYGAGEDHLNRPYIGLYDYPGTHGVHSYSRQEWKKIFHDTGLDHYSFLYPFPDYKLPYVVLGDDFVRRDPHAYSLLYRMDSRDYISSWRPEANEFLSWKGVHRAGLLPELANSFLVVASADNESVLRCVENDFIHFSGVGRQPAMRTATFKKTGEEHVVKKYGTLSTVSDAVYIGQQLTDSPYHTGELLVCSWLESLVGNSGFQAFFKLLKEYYNFLEDSFAASEKIEILVDLLPSNIIVDQETGDWNSFDLEWCSTRGITMEFVFFRALFWFAVHNRKTIFQADREERLQSVDDFVCCCFKSIDVSFQKHRNLCINQEEQFHHAVTAGLSQEIDVSYMLAMPLEEDEKQESEQATVIQEEKKIDDSWELVRGLAKRAVKMLYSYLLNRHCRTIRSSRLFDAEYYVGKDETLRAISVDPLLHYVENGYREGRNPSPFFLLDYYEKNNPDIKEKGIDPLLHYLESGWQKRTATHPLLENYLLRPGSLFKKAELKPRGVDGCAAPEALSYFDQEFYCRKYLDIAGCGMIPVVHYLVHGGEERRQPGPFFDPGWYVDRTPFYNTEKGDLLDHYLNIGAAVGKSPIPVFSPEFYREQNRDIIGNEPDVFAHYLTYGLEKDLLPCAWFDPSYYRLSCTDLAPYSFPLDHYLYQGVHEGIYVNSMVADLPVKPLLSVIVPVYNVSESYLNCCIRSVLYQSYPHWELCLVDDGSSEKHVKGLLHKWEQKDKRIKVRYLSKNQGISIASNTAADMAVGEFLVFLDNDDELHHEALYRIVENISQTDADLLYSDEELIGDDGSQHSVFSKPDFNRELLLCHNYITHLVVTRRKLFYEVGGFAPSLSGAQDFDLFLKLSEKANRVEHISRVLYRWRASETSTSINHEQKDYANEAGFNALNAVLERQGIRGVVLMTDTKFYYRVKREINDAVKVSVIILAGECDNFEQWLRDLVLNCSYSAVEFLVCVEKEKVLEFQELVAVCGAMGKIHLHIVDSLERVASCYNDAVENCSGTHVVFLNVAVKVLNSDWVEALLEYSELKTCGMVGGRLLSATEEENLSIPDVTNDSPAYYARFIRNCTYYMNRSECSQQVSMVSSDFTMISRKIFIENNGFDEGDCSCLFMDCDLSLRLVKEGYQNMYTPYAQGQWLDVEERVRTLSTHWDYTLEKKLFQKRWSAFLATGDPFYNSRVVVQQGVEKTDFEEWYSGGFN